MLRSYSRYNIQRYIGTFSRDKNQTQTNPTNQTQILQVSLTYQPMTARA
jgi:hypothetical protein